jgi:hypothetical protein
MQLFACFHGFGALALGRVSPRFACSCGPGATYDRRQLGSSESTLAHSAVVYLAPRGRPRAELRRRTIRRRVER